MAECIEREAVFSAIWKTSAEHDVFFPAIILDAIKSIPAADVRPVVLCRDCKNYIERSGACAYLVVGMREDDFCSYGKKKEES